MIYRGDDESKGKWMRLAFKDPFIYLAGAAFFTSSVANTGFSTFLPTIIKGLVSLQVNYLTIPVYALGAISLITVVYASDRMQQRALWLVLSTIPVIVGYLICIGTSSAVGGYIAMFILVCGRLSTYLSTMHTI